MSALLNPALLAPLVEMISKAVAEGVRKGMEDFYAQKPRESAGEKK